ncbi:MAG: nicotinate (nicotinamide) nucleotide adenylyltransferase [Bacteroidales bacterium]|nr:nicotinate (nicotinamide) nucleotide adenylyltransferase [Bacteroidales bacterium]
MKSGVKTGLFFGSFNPVHIGHLMIASYMAEFTDIDQVWFVVSPQNPLKEKTGLLADHHRLTMVNLAIEDDPRFRSSNIEFKMPKPSYTIDTLTYLSEKYPGKEFILLAGADILPTFHKWKNWEELLKQYQFYIYPRSGSATNELSNNPAFKLVDAPLITLSSSFIRNGIREGKNLQYFLPEKVWKYIREMHFYEK